jgi:hypothetical protein
MPGAQCTRSLACKMKKHASQVTTGSPDNAGIPCAMVLTVSSALSLVNRACCHHRRAKCASPNLTPASGRRDHTASPSAIPSHAMRGDQRPPPPAPRSWRSRAAPLVGTGWRKCVKVICPTAQGKCLRPIGTTGKSVRHSGSRAAAIRNPFVKTTSGENGFSGAQLRTIVRLSGAPE